jgi:UDP-2,3-diacylglucosamine pyrophosphatase LpxH
MRPRKIVWITGDNDDLLHYIRQAFAYRPGVRLLDFETHMQEDGLVLIRVTGDEVTVVSMQYDYWRHVTMGEGFVARLYATVQYMNVRKRGPKKIGSVREMRRMA